MFWILIIFHDKICRIYSSFVYNKNFIVRRESKQSQLQDPVYTHRDKYY
jgi:hypothetical protein